MDISPDALFYMRGQSKQPFEDPAIERQYRLHRLFFHLGWLAFIICPLVVAWFVPSETGFGIGIVLGLVLGLGLEVMAADHKRGVLTALGAGDG